MFCVHRRALCCSYARTGVLYRSCVLHTSKKSSTRESSFGKHSTHQGYRDSLLRILSALVFIVVVLSTGNLDYIIEIKRTFLFVHGENKKEIMHLLMFFQSQMLHVYSETLEMLCHSHLCSSFTLGMWRVGEEGP